MYIYIERERERDILYKYIHNIHTFTCIFCRSRSAFCTSPAWSGEAIRVQKKYLWCCLNAHAYAFCPGDSQEHFLTWIGIWSGLAQDIVRERGLVQVPIPFQHMCCNHYICVDKFVQPCVLLWWSRTWTRRGSSESSTLWCTAVDSHALTDHIERPFVNPTDRRHPIQRQRRPTRTPWYMDLRQCRSINAAVGIVDLACALAWWMSRPSGPPQSKRGAVEGFGSLRGRIRVACHGAEGVFSCSFVGRTGGWVEERWCTSFPHLLRSIKVNARVRIVRVPNWDGSQVSEEMLSFFQYIVTCLRGVGATCLWYTYVYISIYSADSVALAPNSLPGAYCRCICAYSLHVCKTFCFPALSSSLPSLQVLYIAPRATAVARTWRAHGYACWVQSFRENMHSIRCGCACVRVFAMSVGSSWTLVRSRTLIYSCILMYMYTWAHTSLKTYIYVCMYVLICM